MNCPVCKRDNAFTLSICPSCGTMINDSVREELITKITPLVKPIPKPEKIDLPGISDNYPIKPSAPQTPKYDLQSLPKTRIEFTYAPEVKSEIKKEPVETTEFEPKHTSPTLVEFHNKNAQLPEWRLQLKNAVRQRSSNYSGESGTIEIADSPSIRRKTLATSGANALKVEEAPSTPDAEGVSNPKLAAALRRIEKSRRQFLEPEEPQELTFGEKAKSNNTLLYFTAKPNDHLPVTPGSYRLESKASNPPLTDSGQLDTNKLPELPKPAQISSSFDTESAEIIETDFRQKRPIIREELRPEDLDIESIENEQEEDLELQEIDDCAPLAVRFNAGLFDVIIGAFASLILLTPFMAIGGEWFTLSGVLAFLLTTAVVLMIYLTASVGFYGRTFGMRLFSLEVVDIEGEEYPTVHQAAVSSCLYLVSIGFLGAGFISIFFNEENRAIHDIVSRTIVVKEF